jgi:hypothetical protein
MESIVVHYNSTDFESLILHLKGRVVVYDKSGKYENPTCSVVKIPNEGREGATYLHHIIDRYDSLAESTVFLQDDTDNHILNRVQFTEVMEMVHQQHRNFLQYPCTWNKRGRIYRRTIENGSVDNSISPVWKHELGRVCDKLGITYPKRYTTETCAFFLVSRDRIRMRPKLFYEALRSWVLSHPDNEFILELLWYPIFTHPNEWDYR